jgi:NADPH:quinone reductase-like Zn-dependent oxidoreductase
VHSLAIGDRVYGVTNSLFINANAEYAIARADKVAPLPDRLDFVQGASIPVIAVTAWQMLVDYARVKSGQTILVTGANGNVGAYAIQLARNLGAHVVAMDRPEAADALRALGTDEVMGPVADYTGRFDAVLDLVGGDSQRLLLPAVKEGGMFISAVAPPPADLSEQLGVRARFFYVDVTTAGLERISERFNRGELVTRVGTVLPLDQARLAHEMLAGTRDRSPGKIVLRGP